MNLKEYLNDSFENEEILAYQTYLQRLVTNFLVDNEITNDTQISEKILENILQDVLIDLKRLKDYHLGEELEISLIRINSYFASFIIRRKPLFNESIPFINESFAKYVLLTSLSSFSYLEDNEENVLRYKKDFEHHLKYRNINPQTLELTLRSLEVAIFNFFDGDNLKCLS